MSLYSELHSISGLNLEQTNKLWEIAYKFQGIQSKLTSDILKRDPEYQEEIDKINLCGELDSKIVEMGQITINFSSENLNFLKSLAKSEEVIALNENIKKLLQRMDERGPHIIKLFLGEDKA